LAVGNTTSMPVTFGHGYVRRSSPSAVSVSMFSPMKVVGSGT
jgi:hypothetical protein